MARLTRADRRATMMSVDFGPLVRRLVAITLLVLMAPVTYASVACAGWSGSAAERMACCQRSGDACASLSADDCCAAGEQRRSLETAPAILITPGDMTTAPVAAPAQPIRRLMPSRLALGDWPDTYLLDSVFLI